MPRRCEVASHGRFASRPDSSFSQGAACSAPMTRYIVTMPLSSDDGADEQTLAVFSSLRKPGSNARATRTGDAAVARSGPAPDLAGLGVAGGVVARQSRGESTPIEPLSTCGRQAAGGGAGNLRQNPQA